MHKNNMNKNKPLKNKKEALEYCINKGFNEEDAKFIVNNAYDYHSINELEDTIIYLEEEKKWKNRSIWKKIVFDNDRKLRFTSFLFIFCSIITLLVGIVKTGYLLRTYYIGQECPLGTEPSWLKRSCVEVVCNGSAIDEKGIINEKRLHLLDTFIYQNSGNGLRKTGCISKCTDLDEEYYQNNVISTKSSFGDNRRPSYYYYYYWKDGQCNLLPEYKNALSKDIELRRQREEQVRVSENKELADKIQQEEDALKQYFLRILEENKEYYKKARYNH